MVKFQKADIVRKAVIFYKVAAFFILNIKYDTYTWQYAYMDEIGHFLLKQYVYGILASSNAVSTDITYYYKQQR